MIGVFPPQKTNNSSSNTGLQGTWDASTNTPALANTDTGKTGVMYQVSVGGTVDFGAGNITFETKDIVINNGAIWDKIDATDAVVSVNGNTGVVSLDKTDIGLTNVDNTSDVNKPISNSTQTALNSKASASHTHTESEITDLDKYTKAETDSLLDDKVDKDGAKVLSDNNYTTTEKNKLAGIASGAQVNTVTSVASKTGAVDLVKGDVGLGNVDNTSDANKPVSTAQQTALDGKANTSHTHTESDITDLDKYTQSEVDALIVNKAEIYTMRVSADLVLDDFNDWSAYGGDLVLPVGTYAYNGKLLVSSLDYGNLGIKVQVVRTSGGTITVDGMYELMGSTAAETGGNDCLRAKLVDNGSSIVDIDEQFPTISVLYGWVDVSGEITVTSSPATLQMRVGRMNTDTDAATIYKGSNINFIKL